MGTEVGQDSDLCDKEAADRLLKEQNFLLREILISDTKCLESKVRSL